MLLAAVLKQDPGLLLLFYIMSGLSWTFFAIFYGSFGLRVGEELLGANMAARSLSYTIGSLISGFLIDKYGFFYPFLLGFAIFLIAPLPFLLAKSSVSEA